MWSAALGQPSKSLVTKSGHRPKVDSKHFPTAFFRQDFLQWGRLCRISIKESRLAILADQARRSDEEEDRRKQQLDIHFWKEFAEAPWHPLLCNNRIPYKHGRKPHSRERHSHWICDASWRQLSKSHLPPKSSQYRPDSNQKLWHAALISCLRYLKNYSLELETKKEERSSKK